ncbi:MAG: phytanoyl-CoA dioxygenase family protein [Trueperaceae bacterium]|nr:MAG: phytanoyl-CoA dioxygenase family protein [Trueperaceae bacterium]
MKTEITKAQIEDYRENGFLVIPDFLTLEELTVWRDAVDDAVAARGRTKLAGREQDAEWQEGDGYYDRVFIQRINLWQDHDKMRQLMIDDRLGKMATELAGVEGIRIWHDQALNKQPWGNPTGWHLDNPYWSFHSKDAISIWVALDDATLENGCLYFLPGTHREATFENTEIGERLDGLFTVYPQWATKQAVPVPMKAGSCSFHNGIVAHGAGANMTPGWRRAMTCAYMPDGSIFNGKQNVLPDAYFSGLEIGDVLDDDDQNPLIYHVNKPYVTV